MALWSSQPPWQNLLEEFRLLDITLGWTAKNGNDLLLLHNRLPIIHDFSIGEPTLVSEFRFARECARNHEAALVQKTISRGFFPFLRALWNEKSTIFENWEWLYKDKETDKNKCDDNNFVSNIYIYVHKCTHNWTRMKINIQLYDTCPFYYEKEEIMK